MYWNKKTNCLYTYRPKNILIELTSVQLVKHILVKHKMPHNQRIIYSFIYLKILLQNKSL